MNKKVFVSGCYDMLHSGHVAFFEEAAQQGDLYVGIGSDRTINELKARKTINSDAERLYMVNSLKVVKQAWINSGGGLLDFVEELKELINPQENIKDTLKHFNELRDRWKNAGPIPKDKYNHVWNNYHFHIEIDIGFVIRNKI